MEKKQKIVIGIVIAMQVVPVSYTHLDVYKRQVSEFWALTTKTPHFSR